MTLAPNPVVIAGLVPGVHASEPTRHRLAGVESLRGIAALLVVLMHTGDILHGANAYDAAPFAGFFAFGRAGVDFFFVLSGFIITFVHFRDLGRPGSFPTFWRKRLLRIYPSWLIVSALFSLLLLISPTHDGGEQDPAHLIASFLLLPEIQDPILGVGWSLRHELLFYALFSVLLLRRRVGIALFAAWAAGIVLNMAAQLATGAPLFPGLAGILVFRGFNLDFFFGIATALAVRAGIGRHWRLAVAAGAAIFLMNGMFESFAPPVMHEWPIRNLAYAAGAGLILYGTAMLDRAGQSRTPPLLLRLGTASYSIYLIHVPVLLVLEFALRPIRTVLPIPAELAFPLLAACAVAVGVRSAKPSSSRCSASAASRPPALAPGPNRPYSRAPRRLDGRNARNRDACFWHARPGCVPPRPARRDSRPPTHARAPHGRRHPRAGHRRRRGIGRLGHPGLPMGMADAATALWTRVLRFDAGGPAWPDRDRFVLSAGHGVDAALRRCCTSPAMPAWKRATSPASASSTARPPATPTTPPIPPSRPPPARSVRAWPTPSAWRLPNACSPPASAAAWSTIALGSSPPMATSCRASATRPPTSPAICGSRN